MWAAIKQFLQDGKGKLSMMRLGFIVSIAVGSFVAVVGSLNLNAPHAGSAITAGLALVGSGGWAKAVQSKWEGRKNDNTGTD